MVRPVERFNTGYFVTVGSGLIAGMGVVQGVLQWIALLISIVVGVLTALRLLRDLRMWPYRRDRDKTDIREG